MTLTESGSRSTLASSTPSAGDRLIQMALSRAILTFMVNESDFPSTLISVSNLNPIQSHLSASLSYRFRMLFGSLDLKGFPSAIRCTFEHPVMNTEQITSAVRPHILRCPFILF